MTKIRNMCKKSVAQFFSMQNTLFDFICNFYNEPCKINSNPQKHLAALGVILFDHGNETFKRDIHKN